MASQTIKSFGKYILSVVVAILLFLSGAVTDIGQLAQVVIDPSKAIAQAAVLINDTPKTEIVKAVAEEVGTAKEVNETVNNIKPLETGTP